MTTLSGTTIGLLTDIAVEACTADQLETLLLRAGLKKDEYPGYDRGGSNKHGRVRRLLVGAREFAESRDADAHRSLLTFTRALAEKNVADPEEPTHWFGELCEALLGDGYQLTSEDEAFGGIDDLGFAVNQITVTYRILPTDSGPVPLASEISALERDLDKRGYADARSRYEPCD